MFPGTTATALAPVCKPKPQRIAANQSDVASTRVVAGTRGLDWHRYCRIQCHTGCDLGRLRTRGEPQGPMAVIRPRPDFAAHQRAMRAPFPEVAEELRELLGARLAAYIGGVTE